MPAPPASTEIQGVANALATLLEGLGMWVPRVSGKNAWAPKDLDRVPAGVVELPAVRRPGVDEVDNAPLGSNEWLLEFTVSLYFDLSEAAYSQAEAVDHLEAFISAVNTDRGLGIASVIDSSVVSAELVLIDDRKRPMVAYECQVDVLKVVADPDP